jgi:hypothetical protein
MEPGTQVMMTEDFKSLMRANGSRGHIDEFGACVGIVEGLLDYNNPGSPHDPRKVGPELDVRWQPSNLRYGYHPENLRIVAKSIQSWRCSSASRPLC